MDLIVAAQEIGASTAQLVIASRVKASPRSTNLTALNNSSKKVINATGAIIATAKNNTKIMEEADDLDFSKLTSHQSKTLEMEIQVKVLELEQRLQNERMKLAEVRKQNYK